MPTSTSSQKTARSTEYHATAAMLGKRYDISCHCYYYEHGFVPGEWVDADTLEPVSRWAREARRIKYLSSIKHGQEGDETL